MSKGFFLNFCLGIYYWNLSLEKKGGESQTVVNDVTFEGMKKV